MSGYVAYLAGLLSKGDDTTNDSLTWLVGAYLVNSGQGAFSSVIREYNSYQGLLRYGQLFSDVQLQNASNAVGNLVGISIAKDGVLPTVQSIGDNDLLGVRDVLYTTNGDNLVGHDLYLNQAWPGILMLNKLHETGYVDRLLESSSIDGSVTPPHP